MSTDGGGSSSELIANQPLVIDNVCDELFSNDRHNLIFD
jgi:hypothetical protein